VNVNGWPQSRQVMVVSDIPPNPRWTVVRHGAEEKKRTIANGIGGTKTRRCRKRRPSGVRVENV
jgi:hypothetical protein